MKPVISISFFSLLILLVSCRPGKNSRLAVIDVFNGQGTAREFWMSEVVSDVEYVKLETRKACLYSWANYSVGRKYILAVQQYKWVRLQYPILEKKNFYLIRKLDGDFNQMDSLYPVTNKVSPGGGFSSGLSDFYLSADILQFRQFSTDTLYSILYQNIM